MKNMAITKMILFCPLEGKFFSPIPAGGTCDKTQFGTLSSSCLFTFPVFYICNQYENGAKCMLYHINPTVSSLSLFLYVAD